MERQLTPQPLHTRQRLLGDDGAALVEAAFVTPVLVFFLLGILEYGLQFLRYQSLRNVTVVATRTASVMGRSATADYSVLQRFKQSLGGLDSANINYIMVWKPSGPRAKIETDAASCAAGSATVNRCNRYSVADFSRPVTDFNGTNVAPDAKWPGKIRNDANTWPNGADFISVYVSYNYKYISGLFGTQKTLTDYTIYRIEPQTIS
jgi:hypothetical protein